MPRLRRGRRR